MMAIIYSFMTLCIYYLLIIFLPKSPLRGINPILMAILLIVAILLLMHVPYDVYQEATSLITHLLGPIVVMLALPLYHNRRQLKVLLRPIFTGIIISILTSTFLVVSLGWLFNIDSNIVISLLPKSITTPMAIEVTNMLNGPSGLTIIFVILTGVIGASIAPFILKIFRVQSPIAMGIGIGASSHGIGTSKAIAMDEKIGAASGLAMGVAGITTVLLASIVSSIIM